MSETRYRHKNYPNTLSEADRLELIQERGYAPESFQLVQPPDQQRSDERIEAIAADYGEELGREAAGHNDEIRHGNRLPTKAFDQQRSDAVTEIRFGPNKLTQSEEERRAIAAGNRLAELVMLRHANDCKVHEPTLRPCSCGLETMMRQLIADQSAAIAERDATIAALRDDVQGLQAFLERTLDERDAKPVVMPLTAAPKSVGGDDYAAKINKPIADAHFHRQVQEVFEPSQQPTDQQRSDAVTEIAETCFGGSAAASVVGSTLRIAAQKIADQSAAIAERDRTIAELVKESNRRDDKWKVGIEAECGCKIEFDPLRTDRATKPGPPTLGELIRGKTKMLLHDAAAIAERDRTIAALRAEVKASDRLTRQHQTALDAAQQQIAALQALVKHLETPPTTEK